MLRRFVSCAFALALLYCHPVIAQSWITLAPMPNSLFGVAAGVVDNTIYVLGGASSVTPEQSLFAYDPGSGNWTTKAPMPMGRIGAAAAVVNGVLYAFGGTGDESGVEAYDRTTNTWAVKASMPTPRVNAGAAAVNGGIYVIGGHNSTAVLSSVELYDPSTNTWTQKAPMPTARTMLAVAVIDGVVYAVGGFGGIGNELEAYDPGSNTWTKKAAMPTARRELTAGVLNGELYAIGGITDSFTNAVESYNPTTDTWSSKPMMPTARSDTAAASTNAAIYVFGGIGLQGILSTNEAFSNVTQLTVTINIKPGSSPNTINLGSAGVVPVAILSSPAFDATQVDPATIRLSAAAVRLDGRSDKSNCNVRDVNHDGRPDLVCRVNTAQFTIQPGSTTAVLTARTFGGQVIQGQDSITIVP